MYSWVIFLISISVNSPLTAKYFIIFTSLVCLSLGIEGSSENSCLLRLKEQAVKNKTKSWRRLKCCIELRGAAEKGDHFSGFITTSNLFHITLTQTKHFDERSFTWTEHGLCGSRYSEGGTTFFRSCQSPGAQMMICSHSCNLRCGCFSSS